MILVTGGAGYIGSVLVRQLLRAGHGVRVLDNLSVGGCSLVELVAEPKFEFVHGDLREDGVVCAALQGCEAVVHLAAIVGDPACRAQPELAKATNLEGSKLLFRLAVEAGCRRFVFASTCSNYGRSADPDTHIGEDAPLAPVSLYAETKVAVEQFLLDRGKTGSCLPTSLRFATVYGSSPRMRFDLTVNEFARDVALGRALTVYGEQFWRPYCHVVDLGRSVGLVLDAADKVVAYQVFNVGATEENYTKRMIVEELCRQAPDTKVQYVPKTEDPRDYRVDFRRIKERLGFEITRRVPDGIREVFTLVRGGLIPDPDSKRYGNT